MKAWHVYLGDEFCGLFHAETRGQAKIAFIDAYGYEREFIDVGAKRLPGLDDKPITYQNAKDAGFEYVDVENDWQPVKEDEFINDCHCNICRGE